MNLPANIKLPAKLKDIYNLENLIAQMPQIILPLEHEFCDGLYSRTIFMPAGSIVVSQVHRTASFMFVRYGDFFITTDTGTLRLATGATMITKPGAKRALHMIEDTAITTVHANPDNITDHEEIWEMLAVHRDDIDSEIKGDLP